MKKLNGLFYPIIAFSFLLYLGFMLVDACNESRELKNCVRYTVATVIKFRTLHNAGKDIQYTYTVGGKEYKRGESYQGGEPGKRYFLMYSCTNPEHEEFLQDTPVPDTIKNVPIDGWDKLPLGR